MTIDRATKNKLILRNIIKLSDMGKECPYLEYIMIDKERYDEMIENMSKSLDCRIGDWCDLNTYQDSVIISCDREAPDSVQEYVKKCNEYIENLNKRPLRRLVNSLSSLHTSPDYDMGMLRAISILGLEDELDKIASISTSPDDGEQISYQTWC